MSAHNLWWIAAAVLLVYAVFCLLLYIAQRKMIYLPSAEARVENAAAIRLASDGETLKVWRLGDGRDALVYFGGNAEDVALTIPAFSTGFSGYTIYLANYRGYGGSSGTPSEAGLLKDALALYDYARLPRLGHRNISLIGRSLGSAVAAHVAAQREVHKLVLVTPFDSVLKVARGMFPLFPVSLLLKDRYDTAALAHKITAPVLILIAAHDHIIPRKRTDALTTAFPTKQITVTVLENADHNDVADAPEYDAALSAFFID